MVNPVAKLIDDSARDLQKQLEQIDSQYRPSPLFPRRGVACIPCTKNHLSTVAGALSEAVRFARSEGVSSDEVRRRLGIVEDELNIWERVDATPDKLEGLNSTDKKVMTEALKQGRALRHYLEESGLSFGKGNVDCVEKAYTMAAQLRDYFRMKIQGASTVAEKPKPEQLETPLAQKVQEASGVKDMPAEMVECPPCDLDFVVDLAIKGIKDLDGAQQSVEYAALKSRVVKLKCTLDGQLRKVKDAIGSDKLYPALQDLFDRGTYTIDDVVDMVEKKFGKEAGDKAREALR